jgi:hypothetical protein
VAQQACRKYAGSHEDKHSHQRTRRQAPEATDAVSTGAATALPVPQPTSSPDKVNSQMPGLGRLTMFGEGNKYAPSPAPTTMPPRNSPRHSPPSFIPVKKMPLTPAMHPME